MVRVLFEGDEPRGEPLDGLEPLKAVVHRVERDPSAKHCGRRVGGRCRAAPQPHGLRRRPEAHAPQPEAESEVPAETGGRGASAPEPEPRHEGRRSYPRYSSRLRAPLMPGSVRTGQGEPLRSIYTAGEDASRRRPSLSSMRTELF